MITFVSFQHPVTLKSIGMDHWSSKDRNCEGIGCVDKGTHMLFTMQVGGKLRRVKVPLTNVSQVTEEDELKVKEEL